jgi:hypothetical protein
MKTLFFCLFLSAQAFAQNANITNETNTNNQLLQNSALSEQYQKQAGGTVPRPSTDPSSVNPNTNSNGMNLTDQDKQLSENYINQAGANKIIADKCSGDMQGICAGQAGKDKFLGMDSAMIGMIGKAYAMFSGMSDGKLNMNPTPAVKGIKGAPDTPSKDVPPENDNCKYIPTVTETLATFSQQQNVNNMNSTPQSADTAQRDTLLKAALVHEGRAKVAQIQSVGWYGGAACYAYMATAGGAATDTKMIAKISAGVLLGTFYQSEVSNNQKHADDIRAIADSLPKKGDCNPITQKVCYCAQKSNQGDPQYAQYCLPPGLSSNPIASTSYRVACTDNTMKLDPACNCTRTNTCFDQTLATTAVGGALGIGTLTGAPLSDVRSLSRGELAGGNITGSSAGCFGACAIAKNAMANLAGKIPLNTTPLSPDQTAFAKGLMAKGIPASFAQSMALQNVSKAALDSAMAKLQGASSGGSYADPIASRSNVLDFTGGNGLGISGKTSKKTDDFMAKFTANNKGAANSKVLEFAAQAQRQGQILKSDKPLFEIISNRYQESGRRLLEIDAAR